MICDKCDGSGLSKDNREIECSNCFGTGELDWIENIFGKDTQNISVMDKMNIKRLVDYVRKSIEEVIENETSTKMGIQKNIIKFKIGKIMDSLRYTIFEYRTEISDFENLVVVCFRINPYGEIFSIDFRWV